MLPPRGLPLFDRTGEHLGASDAGINMLRQMLLRQIDVVEEGGDPIALVRDPTQNACINLEGWASERDLRGGARTIVHGIPRVPREHIFDDRYQRFEVPFGTARPPPSPPGL